jgi:hypothetical protein
MPRAGPKTGTKRVPKQANLTSCNPTQLDESPAKPQVPNTPEATHNPKVAGSLSQSLAKVGDSVTYHTYPGVTHSGVLVAAADDATQFIKNHFGR